MKDLVERARDFAIQRHGKQRRKYEDAPYYVHLDRVVELLKDYGYDGPHILAAAYLHDVLEDTQTNLNELIASFGDEVSELVYWLSDIEQGKRNIRKRMSAWRLSRAPLEAKFIKLADLIDNTPSIVEHDPDFAKVYVAEKDLILAEMARVEGPCFKEFPIFRQAVKSS